MEGKGIREEFCMEFGRTDTQQPVGAICKLDRINGLSRTQELENFQFIYFLKTLSRFLSL